MSRYDRYRRASGDLAFRQFALMEGEEQRAQMAGQEVGEDLLEAVRDLRFQLTHLSDAGFSALVGPIVARLNDVSTVASAAAQDLHRSDETVRSLKAAGETERVLREELTWRQQQADVLHAEAERQTEQIGHLEVRVKELNELRRVHRALIAVLEDAERRGSLAPGRAGRLVRAAQTRARGSSLPNKES